MGLGPLCLVAPLLISALPRTLQPEGGRPPVAGGARDGEDASGGPLHTQIAADTPASMPMLRSSSEDVAAPLKLPNLIIQYGEPRTASTLQFQTLCAIALLLNEAEPSRVNCSFLARGEALDESASQHGLQVVKTHNVPHGGFPEHAWVFTSVIDDAVSFDDPWEDAAERMARKLHHEVKYVQVLSRLTGRGSGIATEYKSLFGLSDEKVEEVVAYLRYWDVLRMCCGAQMNDGYREELISSARPNASETSKSEYPACDMYKIQEVERQAVQSQVFRLARLGGNGTRYLRSTSSMEADAGYDLNGHYCGWFNRQVACQELAFNRLPAEPGCEGELREGAVREGEAREEGATQESAVNAAAMAWAAAHPRLLKKAGIDDAEAHPALVKKEAVKWSALRPEIEARNKALQQKQEQQTAATGGMQPTKSEQQSAAVAAPAQRASAQAHEHAPRTLPLHDEYWR